MLQHLSIQNFILIDHLEVGFEAGFTSITGETGAGKSIFVGALSMLLGRRAEVSMIKSGASKSVIEGVFTALPEAVELYLKQNDLWEDDGVCILRRELPRTGRSRCFINDSPVTLSDLAQVGVQLIDVHSQHQNLALARKQFHLELLDRMLEDPTLLQSYATSYATFTSLVKEQEELLQQKRHIEELYDYNLYRYEELRDAQLVAGEEEILHDTELFLQHAEEIKYELYQANERLSSAEGSIVDQLNVVLDRLEKRASLFPEMGEQLERLGVCIEDLRDLSADFARFSDRVDTDPEVLHRATDRLDFLNDLFRKYNVNTTAQLLALRDEFYEKVQTRETLDESLAILSEKCEAAEQALIRQGAQLSEARHKAARQVSEKLTADLRLLEMPHATVDFLITPSESPMASGCDRVSLLFGANGKTDLRSVEEVASGGEIARLMLSIKAMLAAWDNLPTILFDEIDTGVSGRVADRMGKVLRSMGGHLQVFAITHLPQIAARSAVQMFISKQYDEETDTARTDLRELSPEERTEEIARLISGNVITPASLAAAQELLQNND